MDRKKQLKFQYKETAIKAGVFQIKNNLNGKIYIKSTKNLKTMNGTKFSLENGGYITNRTLQHEWNQFGKEAFSFEVIEILKDSDEPYFNVKEALGELEEKWLENLQPYGDRGYH